jgi:hypothetical protein
MMHLFFSLLFCLMIAIATSQCAIQRGRNPRVWFISALFFGVFALIALFLIPRAKRRAIAPPAQAMPPTLTALTPSQADKLWYYLDEDKKQLGPMSFIALGKNFHEGKLQDHTYVWNEEMEQWMRFNDVIKTT